MKSGTAKFYGVFYKGVTDAVRRCEFLGGVLLSASSRVVDVSAGVGDLAFELARRGHQVLGFEPCGEIYTVLFDRYARQPDIRHLVTLFPSRFEDYPLDPQADLVIASNHWSHLGPEEGAPLLRRVHDGLRGGGLLVMNCVQETPLRRDQPWAEVQKRVFGEMTIRHFASSTGLAGTSSQRIRFEFRLEHEGRHVHTESSEFHLTMTSPEDVRRMLTQAGFGNIRIRGGYADVEYDSSSPGFVVMAEKVPEEA